MVDATPVGRFGELEEIANLSAYLVSDFSTFMNGAVSKTQKPYRTLIESRSTQAPMILTNPNIFDNLLSH